MTPQRRTERARALLTRYPSAAIVPVAWGWILAERVAWVTYIVSLVLLGFAAGLEIRRARRRLDRPLAGLMPALMFLAAVGCLRQSGGGLASGVEILSLLPVFQSALFGRDRRELWVILAATAVQYLAPILIVGGSQYPSTQYRAGVLAILVSLAFGLSTHRLVGQARREARDAQLSRSMLEQVSGLVHELFNSRDVRADLSAGALRIAGASLAVLFEYDRDAAQLRSTSVAGVSMTEIAVDLSVDNPVGRACLTGRPQLVEKIVESQLAAPEFWHATGRPETVLYQPLVRGEEVIGVLGVGWQSEGGVTLAGIGGVTGARASVVSLLAHEAALVLDRFDRVTALTDMAQTDALTGLANRRAWDQRVTLASREGHQITVALLDIDHFKRFNDTHGHPAGDRLLREIAAAWREHVRGGDLLARIGGEEFGLLLLDCAPGVAAEVTERLRTVMPGGETCSAGLAVRRPDEPMEAVTARADRALYDAKSAGRDLACTAV